MTDENGVPSTLAEAAVWYCEHGFAIFPLHPRSKKPAMKNGLNGWFTDPEDARKLWGSMPDLNIGITCGTPSHGLLVLDFDEDDEDGEHGLDTLNEWEETHGELPPTATVVTGRGGMHYLYRTDRTNIHPSTNKDLGVDVRCDGSYIVAPPSVHPNGRAYCWNEGDAPWERDVAEADHNVYDLLDHVQRNGGVEDGRTQGERFELPERIRKGERDNTLYKYGCSLRGRGYPDDAILAMLDQANREHCTEALDYRDVQRIARSVCRKGPGHDGLGTFIDDAGGLSAPGRYRIGEADGDPLPPFRTERGKIQTNRLARVIIDRSHARHIDGAAAVWTGSRWEFGKRAVSRVALSYADDISMAQKNEVFSYIQDMAPQVTAEKSFDQCYYVQFANCTYDVMAGATVDPNFQMLVTGTLAVDLDLDAPYGLADRFLESLAGGDEATEQVLKEIVGACMCSRRVLSQAPMLIGRAGGSTAANGKSTFLNVLRSMLGSENVSSLDIATLGQRFQAGRLVGKLANLGDDIPDGFLRGEELSLFKKLVTGDAIYTDVKNAEGFEFRPSCAMVFSMNAMPRLADTTDGVFRRLAFVPFRAHFAPGEPEFNPEMEHDMTRPENLRRLALLGLQELPALVRRGALTPIPDMVAEVEEVRIDNDVVKRWIYDEDLDESHFDHVPTQDAFDEFSSWCDRAKEKFPAQKSTFTRRIMTTYRNVKVASLYSPKYGKKVRTYVLQRNDG